MKVKTSELEGTALNWAAAKANGWIDYPSDSKEHGDTWHLDSSEAPFGPIMRKSNWKPSTDWAIAGPIIEREGIHIGKRLDYWVSQIVNECSFMEGETPLIAAMRCYVTAKLGSEIEIPDELVDRIVSKAVAEIEDSNICDHSKMGMIEGSLKWGDQEIK